MEPIVLVVFVILLVLSIVLHGMSKPHSSVANDPHNKARFVEYVRGGKWQ